MLEHPLFKGFPTKPGSRRGGSEKKPSHASSLHALPNPINPINVEAPGTQGALLRAHNNWKQRNEALQNTRGLRHIALGGTMIVVGITLAVVVGGDPVTNAQAAAQAGVALVSVVLTVLGVPVTIYGFLEKRLKDDDKE